MPRLPALATDVAVLWPQSGEFRAALNRFDWTGCRAVLDAVTPAERTRLIRLGAEEKHLEDFLRGLVRADPGDAAAFALLAHHLTVTGWEIRSNARANNVSHDQWRGFYHWLHLAEQVSIEAAARHPDDPAVWTVRLTSARGISLGQDEAARRYARLAAIDEHHLPAQVDHLQQLTPKWSGSWAKAHGFARERMLAAPPGAPQGQLVAEAHVEHLIELDGNEQNRYQQQSLPEVHEAASRSVWHPAFVTGDYAADLTLGEFAVAFRLFEDRPAAARVFRQMGQRAAVAPWSNFIGGSEQMLHAAREWALRGER